MNKNNEASPLGRHKDFRPYIERVDPDLCHLCKDRKHGGTTIADEQIPICDVCRDSLVNGNFYTEFISYIGIICHLSSKSIDITSIRENEEILGEILYPEDCNLTVPEQLCRLSDTAFYVRPYSCRWIILDLKEGYLICEMDTNIGFIVEGDYEEHKVLPRLITAVEGYISLYPSQQFAHTITQKQIAANTI